MTIKKRIFITNTIMVLFSLIFLLLLGSGMIEMFKGEFLKVLSDKVQLADHTYEIQEIMNDESNMKDGWDILSLKIGGYGYHLYVIDEDGEVLYSNISHAEKEGLEGISKIWDKQTYVSKIYYMENVTMIKSSGIDNDVKFTAFATYSPGKYKFFGISRGMLEMFIIIFLSVGLIAIMGILFCSQILTRKLISHIMHPIDKLNDAAKRIDNGNLEVPIDYIEKDEFYEVCQTFNNMQIHLKEGIEKNAAYEKARTDMISGISHDLRTPLTAMKGSIRGILDGVANTSEKQKQYLEIAYKKTCDMEVLLQKLFYFSKLETGNMPFFKQKINLNNWLKDYFEEKSFELKEKKVKLFFESSSYDDCANIDVEQVKRVFDNIIENSIKYADTEDIEISIKLREENEKNIISFSDNGKGVEPEKLDHIFDQFYRCDESRNSKKDGNGLGLYICKYIIRQHGGNIEARNNNGLTIIIELPKGEHNA